MILMYSWIVSFCCTVAYCLCAYVYRPKTNKHYIFILLSDSLNLLVSLCSDSDHYLTRFVCSSSCSFTLHFRWSRYSVAHRFPMSSHPISTHTLMNGKLTPHASMTWEKRSAFQRTLLELIFANTNANP